jgi:hypothetical protein
MTDLPSKPKIYAVIPPPVLPCYNFAHEDNLQGDVINKFLPQAIPKVAGQHHIEVIDIFNFMGGHDPKKLTEHCNEPNEAGGKTDGFHYGH